MLYFAHLSGDMAALGQIPREPWQIQPTTPFDISPADLFFTDHSLPVNEDESPEVIGDEADCNSSIHYSDAIHSLPGANRRGVLPTPNYFLDVWPLTPFARQDMDVRLSY